MSSNKIALFLDYENVPNVQLAKNWINFAWSKGTLVVQNAYTREWKESRRDGRFLKGLGFCLISAIFDIKNSVDCKCMSDCLRIAKSKSSPDTFIIVTGDGDYAQLLNILKGYKKRTIVVARRGSENKELKRIAHEFYFVDEFEDCFAAA
jgi:uncharacterized LabA/DUF88 family protein